MTRLTYQERKVLLFLSFLLILGFSLSIFRKAHGPKFCLVDFYSEASRPAVIDLNEASRQELIALPGIGERTADSIISYRAEQGGFKNLDELKRVKGIGDSKLKTLRDYLCV